MRRMIEGDEKEKGCGSRGDDSWWWSWSWRYKRAFHTTSFTFDRLLILLLAYLLHSFTHHHHHHHHQCGLLTAIAVILIPVPTYLGQSMDKKLGKTVRVASGSGLE